ncbi:MAG: CDGSH iron-sulfur domain-containing protein [Cyanobacteria bacterium J06627_28]
MADITKITIKDSGPYLVKGPFSLVDAEGNEFTIDKEMIPLCRCGSSTTQPFCNGTHRKLEFESVVRAPQEDSE